MKLGSGAPWTSIVCVFLAGSIATALVPETVPILKPIAQTFHVSGASLGWIVSLPTLACALSALAFGAVVDRLGDVRLLLAGMVLIVLGDGGVSLAPGLPWLIAARMFQGLGYVSVTVAGPTFIQRVTSGETRRGAMAFWAAHTPVGFASAVWFGTQLLAAGLSWRFSFLGHAAAAVVIGLAALRLGRVPSQGVISRSAGAWRVLGSAQAHCVAAGALGAGMLQVSVMTLLPSLLMDTHGFSGQQSALVVVCAMLVNWLGAMVVVTTPLRSMPALALPPTAAAAALFGFLIVAGVAPDTTTTLAYVMAFCAAIGAANSLVWSLLYAAVPEPGAIGATAGLVTQGSFIGVLIGPPTFFWMRHQSPAFMATLAIALVALMLAPLFAYRRAVRLGAA